MDKAKVIKQIVEDIKKIRPNYDYIRVTEYSKFYIAATDDTRDPMIFDTRGLFTGRNFVEIKKENLKNPKEVFFEEGKHEK